MGLVSQSDRSRAQRDARSLAIHNLHRLWDAACEAMNLDDPDPDKLIAAIGKVVALAGKTQQAAHNYKGYYYAWKENEPPAEAEAPETAPETKAAAVGSADEIQF